MIDLGRIVRNSVIGLAALGISGVAGFVYADSASYKFKDNQGKIIEAQYTTHPTEVKKGELGKKKGFPEGYVILENQYIGTGHGWKYLAINPKTKETYVANPNTDWTKKNIKSLKYITDSTNQKPKLPSLPPLKPQVPSANFFDYHDGMFDYIKPEVKPETNKGFPSENLKSSFSIDNDYDGFYDKIAVGKKKFRLDFDTFLFSGGGSAIGVSGTYKLGSDWIMGIYALHGVNGLQRTISKSGQEDNFSQYVGGGATAYTNDKSSKEMRTERSNDEFGLQIGKNLGNGWGLGVDYGINKETRKGSITDVTTTDVVRNGKTLSHLVTENTKNIAPTSTDVGILRLKVNKELSLNLRWLKSVNITGFAQRRLGGDADGESVVGAELSALLYSY